MRVLIVDDEPDVRHLYRMAFEVEGVEVDEACDGDECLTRAEDFQPDLVVLDLFMPNRDGLSTLPDLRRTCPDARVFVVSAHGTERVFDTSRSRGATACFDKPNFLGRIPKLVARYSEP